MRLFHPAQRADWLHRMGEDRPPALRNGEVVFALVGVALLAGAIGWAARGERPAVVERRTEVKREIAPCYMGDPPTLPKIPEIKCAANYGADCPGVRPGNVVVDRYQWQDYVRAAEKMADWSIAFWFECDGGGR